MPGDCGDLGIRHLNRAAEGLSFGAKVHGRHHEGRVVAIVQGGLGFQLRLGIGDDVAHAGAGQRQARIRRNRHRQATG